MEEKHDLIIIVDDDPSVRKGIARLLGSSGYEVQTFASAREFLDSGTPYHRSCCLILDVNLPDLNGLNLQAELQAHEYCMPIVFITGYGDIPTSVQAMKQGAVDFLPKPVEEEVLLNAIREALQRDREERSLFDEREEMRERLHTLTSREFEVMCYVIAGFLNKQIAYELGISEKTVKVHRGQVMSKTGVSSVAELTRLADKAGVKPAVG